MDTGIQMAPGMNDEQKREFVYPKEEMITVQFSLSLNGSLQVPKRFSTSAIVAKITDSVERDFFDTSIPRLVVEESGR